MERQRRDELIGGSGQAGGAFGRWPTDGQRRPGFLGGVAAGLAMVLPLVIFGAVLLGRTDDPAAAFDPATLLLGEAAAVAAIALVAAVATALGVRRQRRVNAGLQREVAGHLGAADEALRALQMAGQQPAKGGDMALSAAIDRAVIAARLRAVERYLGSGWAASERQRDQPSGGSAKPAA